MRSLLPIGVGSALALLGLFAAAAARDTQFYIDGWLFFFFGVLVVFLGIGRAPAP